MAPSQTTIVTLGVDDRQPTDHPQRIRRFATGLRRIQCGLACIDYKGSLIYWENTYPPGSPPHSVAPYAFKPLCMQYVAQRGHRVLLWLDSSMVVKKPLIPLFDRIRAEGYLIVEGSHSVGEYCKDEALARLGVTREETFSMPSCSASILGLALDNSTSAEFLHRWVALALDGVTFNGPKYSGERGWPPTASSDPRVKGHRHDQTAASVLALKLGMKHWITRPEVAEYIENDRAGIPATRGSMSGEYPYSEPTMLFYPLRLDSAL